MVKYKHHYITQVIFRLDFEEPKDYDQSIIDSISSKLEDRLTLTKLEAQAIQVMMSPEEETTTKRKITIYEFKDDLSNEIVRIEPQSIVFEIKKYIDFNSFQELVEQVHEIIVSEYRQEQISRMGLRYINEIVIPEGDPFDWTGLIKENLVKHMIVDNRDKLLRAVGIQEYNFDDYYLRFRYGAYNSEHPNPIARKEFLLDYDCYTGEPSDITDIISLMDKLHDALKSFFEASIEDGLRELMMRDDDESS